jgi:carbonic anhydrase/acetyltransferase-like protein (isoleucine patch superfamily)
VVRGDVHWIRIGARSNIQDGTVVHVMNGTHPTTIGGDVTIGHAAVVHGCTIGDRVLIGMGAILLNGAAIGDDSIVAAGTLVTEETKIPPRSLVMGSPGKVKRQLSDTEVASILQYSERYVNHRLDYMTA